MMELFSSIVEVEKGRDGKVKVHKNKRRAPSDVYLHFPCKYCAKVYTTDSSLKRHLKLKHLDIGDDPP